MTYSPMRFDGRSCSSSGQRRQLRPQPPRTTIRPGRRAEAPAAAAAAADAGVAGSGAAAADAADVASAAAADVVADVAAVEVAGGCSSPDTGNQCTGSQASAP